MEHFDVYDELGNKTDKTVPRGAPLKAGEYFLIVHVWIQNPEGKFLIQRRAKPSDATPYLWATTTGGAAVGEDARQAAQRETEEELGLTFDKNAFQRLKIITSTRGRWQTICHVFLVEDAISTHDVRVNPNEVLDVTHASLSHIQRMISDKTFWDYPYLMNDPDYFRVLEKRKR